MGINVGETLMGLVTTSGIYQYLTNPLALIMVAIACVLLYLAIVKQFEPLLLLPIAFGMLLTNLLGSDIFHEELFAGGHANWALFGGAVLIDGKDFVDSVGYMVNAAGQILTSNNVVLGHFVNAVTIDDPTKLVPFADILAQFAANGNAASIILEDAFLKNGAVYTATGAMLATAGKTISAGLLDYLYLGVKLGIYPCLIFMGVGAGTDFGPLISNPKTLLLGAAAQLLPGADLAAGLDGCRARAASYARSPPACRLGPTPRGAGPGAYGLRPVAGEQPAEPALGASAPWAVAPRRGDGLCGQCGGPALRALLHAAGWPPHGGVHPRAAPLQPRGGERRPARGSHDR